MTLLRQNKHLIPQEFQTFARLSQNDTSLLFATSRLYQGVCMRLILSVLMILAFMGCPKKREESFVQGQGKDLLEVSQFDGAEFDVETLEKLTDYKENPAVSKSESVTIKKNSPISLMGAVKVETKADLLGDAPFIALPNKKEGYKIKYMINQNFLVVMKVADKALIHPKEAAGAIKLADGRLAVAIVGYPIKGFFNAENIEQNGAKTNKVTEMSVNDKANSRFFKIDKNARTLYKLQEKLDLFTKEYFQGADGKSEWYVSQTILAAPNDGMIGTQLLEEDRAENMLTKVKFMTNQSQLRIISVNRDKEINQNDEIKQLVLFNIPIEWKEYRAKPTGTSSFAMEEEENNSIEWNQRSFMKVDFAKSETMLLGPGVFRLVDLEVDTDYMSYTLFDPNYNMRFKFSFLRDKGNRNYTPKRLLKEDFEKFGFFKTQKHEIDNYKKYLSEDYGTNEFINRYNVKNGEVVFYFTEGSDEKLIPYAAKAADEWTEAFRKAGVPLKITADTEKRVRLGDLRYNQINLFRSTQGSNLYGYGPMITDALTGEIIASTTNMHISTIASSLVDYIRDYLLFKSGKTSSMSVYSAGIIPNSVAQKNDKFVLRDDGDGPFPFKKMPVLNSLNKLEMKPVVYAEADKNDKKSKKPNRFFGRERDISITGKNVNKEIDEMCPELSTVVDAMKAGGRAENENQIVKDCAEKMVPGKMMGTLLHEMGHNFGLRHNFYGSVDAMNFLTTAESGTKDRVNSSSVMEYSAFNEDRLTKVGRYDIAAIRYGYGDSVETADGKILKLDVNKTIDQNVKANNVAAKKYLFCTDEDVAVGTDPMCARFDAGTTPEEIVTNLIAEYNASIADLNYRLNRGREWYDPSNITNYRVRRFWIPLKKMYDEWRFKLSDHLGIGSEYLETFDSEKLEKAIAEKSSLCNMKENPASDDCRFDQYRRAANKIFQFSMQIATLPPKYCIGTRNGSIASVEFADVRRIVMAVNKFVPAGCLDPVVKDYITKKYSFTPESESGYELEDVRLDMKVKMSKTKADWMGNPLPVAPDIIGLMPEKMIAVEILAVRAPLSMSSVDKQFLPNFLDEPKFRETTLAYVAERLSKGVPAAKVTATNKNIKLPEGFFFEKFKYEKKFIDNMVGSIFYGLDVPDKTMASKQRKKKFAVRYTDKKEILDKAKYKVAGLDGTTYYAIMSTEGTEAKKLLQMLETLPKRMEEASPLDNNTFTALLEFSKNILDADGQRIEHGKFIEFFYQLIEDEVPENVVSRSQDEKNIDKYRIHWKKVFAKEVAAVRDAFAQYKDRSGDGGTPSKGVGSMVEDLKGLDPAKRVAMVDGKARVPHMYDKVADLVYDSNYHLNQKIVLDRIEAYRKVEDAKPKTALTEDFFNYEELSTQTDMILDVLRTMTEY